MPGVPLSDALIVGTHLYTKLVEDGCCGVARWTTGTSLPHAVQGPWLDLHNGRLLMWVVHVGRAH